MIKDTLTIINKLGLHARAAAKLMNITTRFDAEITLSKDNKTANAKSILSVMMLSAKQGSTVELMIDGADEANAHAQIKALIENKFDEAE